MPNLRVQNLGSSLRVLFIDNTDLVRDRRFTFLTEDVVASGSTFRVQSIAGFESLTTSSGQIVLVGNIGNERSEILRTSNSTGPSNSYKEITLRDTLVFDHPQDTPITIIDFNRLEAQYATSLTGTKTTITTYPVAIQADNPETFLRDTTEPIDRLGSGTVFYFARFNDSIDSRNSDWSDGVQNTGYSDNTVFAIKKRALDELGEKIDGNITHEFLNQSLWEARREYHKSPGKRPFRRKFNVDIGNVSSGMYRISLPSDTEKPFTAENVYGVRVGTNTNLDYIDKKEWDFYYQGKPHTTLVTTYATTHQDLYLTDVRDFDESGSVTLEGDTIAYSAKGVSGGTLRISTAGSTAHTAGVDVWQNISYGLPDKFTVWADPEGSAYIYFNRPIETAYVDQNIYADYYRSLVGYDSDGDVLDEPEYDFYVDYLKARIKHRKNKGETDITKDSDFKSYQVKKQQALANEHLDARIHLIPDIDPL